MSVSARNLECCFCKACWLGYNRLILKNNQKGVAQKQRVSLFEYSLR